ncbi:ARMT1-like domain-containing protein [Cyanobium gracile UHCC 0139]|uniref:ARMT1-like domain-containing protein n=1 Tax=Cyanobium gracile UHCC 0139 TaxID=3110308 RepID=A0ABU5RTX9_9CYAN|nr:ARMT1-like domain-containing protein [Cyanobium gracile]MEA5391252.1 ARMT1-like domain-containing protein [Cyanobium gracile UHCC 0139]
MKTSLDCIPCLLRQTLEAARLITSDSSTHERLLREALHWAERMDLNQSPPAMAQRIHRRLREMTGVNDPYRETKEWQNRVVMEMLPALQAEVMASGDPLLTATRLAIAGNAIDMGSNGQLTEQDVRQAVQKAQMDPFSGDVERFRGAVSQAETILYLADNAGEIAIDRLLVDQLLPRRIIVVVRGFHVLNDATRVDAERVGLDPVVEVIDNGSDAPGTILSDGSQELRERFSAADLIIAKGQGNYESLSDEPGNIFFLFKVKCRVIADRVGQPMGTQMLLHA